MIPIIIAIAGFTMAFIVLEFVQKAARMPREASRKIAHVVGAIGAAVLPYWLSWNAICFTAGFFIIAMIISKRARIFRSIHGVSRSTYGEVYLPVAIFVLAVMFRTHQIFAYSLFIIGLADVAAEMLGKRYGKKKIGKTTKTFIGSTAFLITAYIIGVLFFGLGFELSTIKIPIFAAVVAIAATGVEAISGKGSDNFAVPLTVAIVTTIIT
jgi:phytol kinase